MLKCELHHANSFLRTHNVRETIFRLESLREMLENIVRSKQEESLLNV